MSETARFRLKKLGPGEHISDDGYAFSNGNIDKIDQIVEHLLELHRHDGSVTTSPTPEAPPGLQLETGGYIPAGERFFYKFTIVDENGYEGEASAAAYIDMPSPVQEPQAPTPTVLYATGTLAPGEYYYAVSAYKDVNTIETRALGSCHITVPGTTADHSVLLDLPALPDGADGLNIYRKTANGLMFQLLDSTSAGTYTDDGTVHPDCDRTVPAKNTTNQDNAVLVGFPGATPVIPEGWSWRIYRTNHPADWSNSFLVELGPDPTDVQVYFLDVGESTLVGAPPEQGLSFRNPDPVVLTDAAEVQGKLPSGLLIVPKEISWHIPGLVVVADGLYTWPNLWEEIDFLYFRPFLDDPVNSYPVVDDIIVDVKVYRGATPTWLSIYDDDTGLMPRIPVGEFEGDPAPPVDVHFVAGDLFRVDVLQAGGGATPLDYDLILAGMAMTKHGSETTTYTFLT